MATFIPEQILKRNLYEINQFFFKKKLNEPAGRPNPLPPLFNKWLKSMNGEKVAFSHATFEHTCKVFLQRADGNLIHDSATE